jgi:hypothetical protein
VAVLRRKRSANTCQYIRKKKNCRSDGQMRRGKKYLISQSSLRFWKIENQEHCSRCNSIARKKIVLRTMKWIKLCRGNYAYTILKNCGGLLLCESSDPSFGLTEFKGRALGRHRYTEWRKSSVLRLDQERLLDRVLEGICLEITQTE